MQYQVFKKDTGDVVAWIDTEQTEQVVHNDYDIKAGENLTAVEVDCEDDIVDTRKYQELARQFVNHNSSEYLEKCFERPLVNGEREKYLNVGNFVMSIMGITGEAGEVADLAKKFIFHKKEVSVEQFKKEIGDVLWYISLLCDTLGLDLEADVMQGNIDKLSARYPKGFNPHDANHRKAGDI